jgi:rhodanese-related sulfurtransferase
MLKKRVGKETEGIALMREKWLHAAWQLGAIVALGCLIGLASNSFRPGGLPLVADWSIKAQLASTTTADTGENIIIPMEDAQILYFANEAVFIDARSESLYRMGHIEGARNLPWEDFENRYQEIMSDISPSTKIITYCDGESCSLSKELAMVLMAKGYSHVRVLLDGWTAWMQANLPVDG